MLTTRFTELVDCSVPLQLAGFAPPLLAAAVCEAGGFGMLGATGVPMADLAKSLDEVHQRTARNFGVNFLPNLQPVEPACSGRAMAAVLAAGADGVRVGTRFLGAAEYPTHPIYLDGLVRAQAQDTVYTQRFSAGGWRITAPHRVLRSGLEAAEAFEGEIIGEEIQPTGERVPVRRFQGDLVPTTFITGRVEAMALWAGESVGGVASVQPAAATVQELVSEAERLLGCWRGTPTRA
jgi:NAD(P)H-dependent flavin oxidoreductase YrpB (nitropropane dioxygenase family)